MTLLLLGCGVDPFPGSPDRTGASDVPFVPTYNFAFRTGFGPVLGIDANLTIISAGDLLNLVAAANVTQRLGTGVITGIVETLGFAGAEGVTLLLTDAEGNVVGDVFYNGLGGVPNFVQTTGTDSTGAFTIFNVPPGEVFLKAIQGGRGNTRLMVFPDAVSLTNFRVLSVIPAKASVASLVLEVTNFIPEDPIGVSTIGIISDEDGDGVLNPNDLCPGTAVLNPVDLRGCDDSQSPSSPLDIGLLGASNINGLIQFTLGSVSTFLLKLFDDEIDHVDTYNEIDTSLFQLVQTQAPQLTRFLTVIRKEHLSIFAQSAGVTIGPNETNPGLLGGKAVIMGSLAAPDGTTLPDSIVTITNAAGQSVDMLGGSRVFYFDADRHPDPARTKTGTNGQFIVFNVPIEPLFIKATADITGTGGDRQRFVGNGEIVPIPNSAYIKNMVMLAIPPPNPLFPNLLPRFSVGVDGKATTSDEVTPVPAGASVAITGVKEASYPIVNGNYNILQSLDPAETGPALAFGHYLLRVRHSDFLDTYNDVTLGFTTATTSAKDLRIYSRTTPDGNGVNDYAAAIGGQQPGLGVITGRVIRNRDGRATAGVSIEVRDASARNTHPVLYFDETTGKPNSSLTETTRNGRYMVFNVPPGLAFISVTSTDDTGNAIVLSFADGVTVRDIGVNEAPPPFVKAKGTVRSLKGDVVDGVSLTALGGDPVRDTRNNLQFFGTSTNAAGEFEETVTPLNQLIIRGRKDSGFYPTYNFGFQTSSRDMVGADLLIVSRTEVLNLLSTETVPIQQDLSKGIITGTALVQDFGNPNSYCSTPTGAGCSVGEPVATVGGFFNEDIVPDLAVLNRVGSNGVGSVAVFFGDGKGGFRTSAEYDVGQSPTALGMGDFNKDNNLDLVVVNSQSDSFTVLLGTRSGRFSIPPCSEFTTTQDCSTGLHPTSVAVGDANGDTNLDLFITNRDTNSVDIFLGDGRGGFSQRDPYPASIMLPTGCGPIAIALTILDNDTLPDWVIACEMGNRLERLISGFGSSRFEPGPLALRSPKGLIVDDFNGDGGADIGVIGLEADVNSSRGMLTVLVSNVLRQDPPPSNVLEAMDISPESIMSGDFNSDGRRDLVVTGGGDPNVQIFLGNGDGTFQKPPILKTVGVSPRGIVAADLNLDGSHDIAVVDPLNRRLYTLMSEDVLAIPDPGSGFTYQVEAVDLAGRPVGEVRYITPQGTLTPDHTKSGGKFLILNVPPGIIFIRTFEGSTGNRIVTVYPDSVSNIKVSLAQGILTSVPVLGVTLDAVARPIGDADITFLGNGSVTFSSPLILQANSVVGGAIYDIFLEANSEFIAKLTKVGGGGFPPVPGDFDFDSIPDNVDDCPGVFNPDQTDTDADNIGDACDPTPTR